MTTMTVPEIGGSVSALEQALIRELGFRAGDEVVVRIGSGPEGADHPAIVEFLSVGHGVARVGDAFFDALTGRLIRAIGEPNPPYCAIRHARRAPALKGGVE